MDLFNQFFTIVYYYFRTTKGKERCEVVEMAKVRYMIAYVLISFIEYHQSSIPAEVFLMIYRLIDINSKTSIVRYYTKNTNIELFCEWILHFSDALNYLKREQNITALFTKMFLLNHNILCRITAPRSQRRIILGFCKLIQFSFDLHQIQNIYTFLFSWLFYYLAQITTPADQNYPQFPN